jgi:hypothetical protein
MAVLTPVSYTGTPGQTIYGGRAAPTSAVVASLVLHNTSGSTQAADFVSPMFGASFAQGAIAAGSVPVFKTEGGTECPATFWLQSYWPDGSLKQSGCMIQVPTSIAGSGSLPIEVHAGGIPNTTSARTLSEVSAVDLAVELVGSANLTGTWTTTPADGIADNSDVMLLGSGPAGSVWWIGAEVKQAVTAHGQLYAWHGIAALSNGAGTLKGFRHFHQVSQPFIDQGGAACTTREMTATLKRGGATIRQIQGIQADRTTQSTNILCAPYASFDLLGTDGKWDYSQGGGSSASDCTIRVVWDKTARLRTHLVPSYDVSATVNDASVVDHIAHSAAGLQYSVQTGGERPDIAVLPSMAARYFINPTANAERHLRAVGLASLNWRVCMRNRATRQIAPATNPRASYTGLATPNVDMYALNGQYNGVNAPASSISPWSEETETHHIPSTGYAAWLVTGEPQYLFSMIDQAAHSIIHRNSSGVTMNTTQPITGLSTGSPSLYGRRDVIIQGGATYPGGFGFFIGGGARIGVWYVRTLAQAAAMVPSALPNGAQVGLYLQDVTSNCFKAYNEYNNLLTAGHRSGGLHYFEGAGDSRSSPWMVGYALSTNAHAAEITQWSEAVAARSHIARWLESAQRDACVQLLTAYRMSYYKEGGQKVEDPEEVLYQIDNATLTLSQSTGRVTVGGSKPWTPSNGDCFAFPSRDSSGNTISTANVVGAAADQRIWFVNVSGQTAQLSLTKGGAPVALSGDQTVTVFDARFKTYPSPIMAGDATSTERLAAFVSYAKTMLACGESNVSAALTALESAATSAGGITGYASDPKHLMTTSYPT